MTNVRDLGLPQWCRLAKTPATRCFYQDALGNINNDGTGLRLTVRAVPAPATWTRMLAGFGLVGIGLRSRRKQAIRVTYA